MPLDKNVFVPYTVLLRISVTILRSENDDFVNLKDLQIGYIKEHLFCDGKCFKDIKCVESHQITYEWCGDFSPSTDLIMKNNSVRDCVKNYLPTLIKKYFKDTCYHLGFSTCGIIEEIK